MMLPAVVGLMQFGTELTMAPHTLQRTLSECRKCSPRAMSMAMRWPNRYQPRCRSPSSDGYAAVKLGEARVLTELIERRNSHDQRRVSALRWMVRE